MDSQIQRRPVQRNRVTSNDGNRAISGERQICLPLALTDQASDKSLTEAYGAFQKEAISLDPSYQPKTVNTDVGSQLKMRLPHSLQAL